MKVDVAVIGAGLPARWLSARLAAGGATVATVAPEGREAAWTGLAPVGLAELPHRTIASLGADRARALFGGFAPNRALLAARVPLRTGAVWAAADDREADDLDAAHAALAGLGIPTARWSAAEIAGWLGTDRLGRGLYLPDDVTVDAAALDAAVPAAGRVADTAAALRDGPGGPEVVLAAGEVLAAEIVVLANGWRAATLAPWLADKLGPYRQQALWTAPFTRPPGPGRSSQGWLGWRPTDDGGLVLTGARWATPHLEEGETEPILVAAVQARLEAILRAVWPDAPAVVRRAARIETGSCDGLPIVGPIPGAPRVVVLSGLHGCGLSLGPWFAEAVATTLLDVPGPRVPPMFDPSRML